MVCFRNISINTLHKGGGDDDDDDNNKNKKTLQWKFSACEVRKQK